MILVIYISKTELEIHSGKISKFKIFHIRPNYHLIFFRWKGENVSTTEVENVISSVAGLRDVTVYGVEVGNLEGRAGMATIVDPDGQLDLKKLAEEFDKHLPAYARPLFLRTTEHADMTGTFKLKKIDLQRQGFNPNVIKDKLYFRKGNSEYVPLTKEIYEDIISGKIRV